MPFGITFQSLLLSDVAAFAFGLVSAAAVGTVRRRRSFGHSHAMAPVGAMVDACPDAILKVDAALVCTSASAASARLLGHAPLDLVGRSVIELAGADQGAFHAALTRAGGKQVGVEAVFRAQRPTGESIWIEARIGPADADGCMVLALRDISTRKTADLALRVANLELNKLAGSDGLTELANRRRFDQTLETECRRASRSDAPLTLLLIDVDRFKSYNDHYGHQAGDACLKQISGALRAIAGRTTDLVARIGGEEFAFLLPGTDEHDGAALAERIRANVAVLAIPHDMNHEGDGTVTVSLGCATVRPTPDSLRGVGSSLIAAADRALYDAKRLGRNRVVAPALKAEANAVQEQLLTDPARLARIDRLRAANALQPSANLNRVARMAGVLLGMPIAFVALLDRRDAIVVGHYGLGDDPVSIPHEICAQLLGALSPVVVPRAATDPRFRDVAAEQGWDFLAAAPLLSGGDLQHVGGLWVIDRQGRPSLDEPKRVLLSRLASLAMEDLDARGIAAEAGTIAA